jgi:hypothetical protein
MNWARLLPSAKFTYNNSRSSSTKITPFRALYRYDPKLQVNITSAKDTASKGEVLVAHDRITRLTELREYLREQLLRS